MMKRHAKNVLIRDYIKKLHVIILPTKNGQEKIKYFILVYRGLEKNPTKNSCANFIEKSSLEKVTNECEFFGEIN